jgi:ketosteroid isomerase-like protein
MHPHAQLIQDFYTRFQRRDAAGMVACYHPEVVFFDPVFMRLEGARAAAMWQMLCGRAKDLEITVSNVRADDQTGAAHWEAIYTFSKKGRKVHNRIDALFEFKDSRIIRHTDAFDLWKWAAMALGPTGLLLGWTPVVQSAIRKDARRSLDAFISGREVAEVKA